MCTQKKHWYLLLKKLPFTKKSLLQSNVYLFSDCFAPTVILITVTTVLNSLSKQNLIAFKLHKTNSSKSLFKQLVVVNKLR